jgi:transketolase
MRQRFITVASSLLDEDPRAAVVLADISVDGFRPASRRHPGRVVNVGIREQAQLGVAAGMAIEGLRPIVHTYAPFLVERPFEQIKLDLGHQDVGAVLVSIGASYDWAEGGRTHQAPEDVALVATLPGWQIHVPGHPDEVEVLLRRSFTHPDRVYLRLSEDTNQAPHPVRPFRSFVARQGTGNAPTIVAVGPMLDRTLAAVSDIDATVVYVATVRPFDHRTLLAVLGAPEVAIVEPYLEGTSTQEVAVALEHLPHRVAAIGVPRTEQRRYGTRRDHDRANGLDVSGIRSRIHRFLDTRAAA